MPRELALLRSAFLEPHEDADLGAFERLQRTIEWSLAGLEGASGVTPDALIREAFASVVRQPQDRRSEVEFAWCEYELYRRTHFACELLLSALVKSVDEASAATLPDVIAGWLRHSALPSLIEERFQWHRWPEGPIEEIETDVETYLDEALPARNVARWPAEAAAAFAVGLLLLVVKQGKVLLRDGRLAVQGSPFAHLVQMVETHGGATSAEFLEKLLGTWLVPQHIHNALRKMASGIDCRNDWTGVESERYRPTWTLQSCWMPRTSPCRATCDGPCHPAAAIFVVVLGVNLVVQRTSELALGRVGAADVSGR